jgi:hypothetical protein
VSDDNILTLSFSEPITLSQAEVSVSIEGVEIVNFTLEILAKTEYELLLDKSVQFEDSSECEVALEQQSASPYVFSNLSATVSLHKSVVPRSAEDNLTNGISALTQAEVMITATAAVALGFMIGSPSAAWVLISCNQLLGYIPMMDIDLPSPLEEYFKASQQLDPLPNLFSYFDNEEGSVPPCARRQGFESSNYVGNVGQLLTTFLLCCVCWPLFCLLGKASKYFERVAGSYRWNFFLRFFIQGYLELLVAAAVQLYSPASSILGTGLSCVTMIVCTVSPVFIANVITRYHSSQSEATDLTANWSSLFEEFKNDQGWLSSAFYVIFLARRLLYVSLLFGLVAFPLVQIILSAVFSAVLATFVVAYRPYRDQVLNVCSVYCELCSVLIFSLCGLFLLNLGSTARDSVMWVALCLGYSITFVLVCAALYITSKQLIAKCRGWRGSPSINL